MLPVLVRGQLTRDLGPYLQGTERTKEHFNIFLEYVPGGSIASLLAKFGAPFNLLCWGFAIRRWRRSCGQSAGHMLLLLTIHDDGFWIARRGLGLCSWISQRCVLFYVGNVYASLPTCV